jgi:prepilin-type N-terminal cleavage/methylation domain-containing protein
MKCISKNNDGFTLIEVLAAITLLAIVIICSLGLIGQSSSFTSKNETNLKAINLARKTIAYLESNNMKVSKPAVDLDLTNYHLTDDQLFPFATFTQNDEEKTANLYRVEIKIYDSKEKRKLLSHTFGYIDGGQ